MVAKNIAIKLAKDNKVSLPFLFKEAIILDPFYTEPNTGKIGLFGIKDTNPFFYSYEKFSGEEIATTQIKVDYPDSDEEIEAIITIIKFAIKKLIIQKHILLEVDDDILEIPFENAINPLIEFTNMVEQRSKIVAKLSI